MNRQHNRWLAWKIKQGLAPRGRADGKLNPKGRLAKFLYRVYFHKTESTVEVEVGETPEGGRLFKQSVGGSLGPTGTLNGE